VGGYPQGGGGALHEILTGDIDGINS